MMRKYIFAAIAVCLTIYMSGCAKKKAAVEESSEPLSMEQLTALKAQNQAVTEEIKTQAPEANVRAAGDPAAQAETASMEKLLPLPPSGPFRPTTVQIQTALKNAGFYTGEIDGKRGPLTKKSVEEFQKANGLEADGRVGPKTWEALNKYLNPAPSAPAEKRKNKQSALKRR